jgi:hypothetical protein
MTRHKKSSDIGDLLFESRGQSHNSFLPKIKKVAHIDLEVNKDDFLYKYRHLEECIDSFKPYDILLYFVKVAEDNGIKYVIASKGRDLGSIKNTMKKYDNREICLMIEFLFESEQDYLDKAGLCPTILSSRWCNTIYRDSLLWVDDKYIPKSKKVKAKREWTDDKSDTKVGEW